MRKASAEQPLGGTTDRPACSSANDGAHGAAAISILPSTSLSPWAGGTIRIGPEYQCELPTCRPSVANADDPRGGLLLSRREVERDLAVQTAIRLTAAAFREPGARLEFGAKGGVSAQPPQAPRPCGTFGCTLPDRHRGLHQVSRIDTHHICACVALSHAPPRRPASCPPAPRACTRPRSSRAPSASGAPCQGAALMSCSWNGPRSPGCSASTKLASRCRSWSEARRLAEAPPR